MCRRKYHARMIHAYAYRYIYVQVPGNQHSLHQAPRCGTLIQDLPLNECKVSMPHGNASAMTANLNYTCI